MTRHAAGLGDARIAAALGTLPPTWTTLDDPTRIGAGGPRTEGTTGIDHVVVGPNGIFAITVQSWPGTITVVDNVVRLDGRSREAETETCVEAVRTVAELAGPYDEWVVPVLCLVSERPVMDWAVDVLVCTAPTLRAAVLSQPVVLTPKHVADAAALLGLDPVAETPAPAPVVPRPMALPQAGPPTARAPEPGLVIWPAPDPADNSADDSTGGSTGVSAPDPAPDPAPGSGKRSRKGLLASQEQARAEASQQQAGQGKPAPSGGRSFRSLTKVLVVVALLGGLLAGGPQIVSAVGSVWSVGSGLSDQLSGGNGAASSCAPARVAASTSGAPKAGAPAKRRAGKRTARTRTHHHRVTTKRQRARNRAAHAARRPSLAAPSFC